MVGFLDKVLGPKPVELLADEHVLPAITGLIGEAEEYLVLVSPYNNYSVNMRDAVVSVADKVQLVAICRKDQSKKEEQHIQWLEGLGAQVHLVERLHAKIYANESQVILTSMNLLQGSAVNSKEIALRIREEGLREQIGVYIENKLIKASIPIAPAIAAAKATVKAPTNATTKAPSKPTSKAATQGYCVRCQKSISFNLKRPLCDDCHPTWDKFKDRDYPEKFCLSCGQQRKNISYAKPRCRRCWREQEKS